MRIRSILALCILVGMGITRLCASEEPAPTVADRNGYLAAFCSDAEIPWPRNRILTIICHGHSVPAGYFKTPDVRTFDAYPHLMHVKLKDRFSCAVINVTVTAIGGEHSVAGARRFDRDVIQRKPDIVTIDYGLNDRAIGLEQAAIAWTAMIVRAKESGIKVLLLTPTPDAAADAANPLDPLNLHAAQIRALAAKHNVGLVDSQAAFLKAIESGRSLTSLMSQRNHPNREGHELVLQELMGWFPQKGR